MGLFGRRESGKTYFVTELLRKQESMIKGPFKKVIWICKTFQHEVYEKLMQEQQFEIEFMDELPNFDALGKQENTAIVLDDLMTEASNNEQIRSKNLTTDNHDINPQRQRFSRLLPGKA